jgi:predicted secreted protein
LQDLRDTTELLITELGTMGLQLNASKTNILTTVSGSRPMHVELAGDSVEILSSRSKHKYLGKPLVGDLRHRTEVE